MRFLLLLLLFPSNSLYAQTPAGDTAFHTYYRLSMDKLRQLYQSRGLSDGGCISEDMSRYGIYENYPNVIRFALQKIYGKLAARTGVLFFSHTPDSLRIWLLRDTVLYSHTQALTEQQLLQLEADLRKSLRVDVLSAGRAPVKRGGKVGMVTNRKVPDSETMIRKVSGILLPPAIARHLGGLGHLMIAPEFNIGQFPFYMLRPFGNGAQLIDSFSISLNPHLCNLLTLDEEEAEMATMAGDYSDKSRRPGAPRSLGFVSSLVVGNPSFSTGTSYNLPPLKGAQTEALQAAKVLEAKALTGKDARIGDIQQKAESAGLLYFATHGVADPSNPLQGSFLAFAPDKSDPTGLWTAEEIQKSQFKASLAILSACQTGVGRIHAGGFIGLGRAFYIARVRNTVMSLWSVDDQSTARLMQYFLEELKKEDVFYPANHLRNAIIRYRKEDKNPSHWAPFVVFGFPE